MILLNSINCLVMIAVMHAATQQMYKYDTSIWKAFLALVFKRDYIPLIELPKKGAYIWYALLRIGLLINIISLIPRINFQFQNIILYATPIIWLSIFFIIKNAKYEQQSGSN